MDKITQSIGLDPLFPLLEVLGLHCIWARYFDMQEYVTEKFSYSDDALKLFTEGKGWFRANNSRWMQWSAPCLFLTRKSGCYDWFAEGRIEAYVMHFECVLSRAPERSLLDALDLPTQWPEELVADLGPLLQEATREFETQKLGAQLILDGYLRLILVRLLRNWYVPGKKIDPPHGLLQLVPALNLLTGRMESIPSISEMAEATGLSTGHFSQQFKTVFNTSPRQYVNSLRIDRARRLLLTTEMTIDQIARSLGFKYTHYFDRLFKRNTHQTPRDYRIRNQV